MRTFNISVDIEASAERVWEVMSDVERWPEWTRSIREVRPIGDASLGPGRRFLIRQPGFLPALWTVATLHPGRDFTWVSRAPGLRVVGSHSVRPKDDGTATATLGITIQGLFGDLFGRMTGETTERYLGLEAAGLRSRSIDPAFMAKDHPSRR